MVRHRRLSLFAALTVPGAIALACTGTDPVLSSIATPDGGSSADGDAPDERDARGDPDDASAVTTTDAGIMVEELLLDPSFEEPGNCARWTPKLPFTTATATPIAHDGVQGCLVCPQGSPSLYSLTQYVPAEFLADGGSYIASAWVRAADGGDVPSEVTLDVSLDNDGKTGVAQTSQAFGTLPADGGWTQYRQRFTYVPATSGTYLEVEVINHNRSTGCFIVDQVSFAAEPR